MINIKKISDIGKVRKENEDFVIVEKNALGHQILILADGMGGHNAGEVASRMACEIVSNEFKNINKEINYKEFIKESIFDANIKIYKKSLMNVKYSKMGTTITLIIYDGQNVFTGHVGDSRIYFINNKEILQITKDHTLVQTMIESGSMTIEESRYSKYKNIILQALGTNKKLIVEIKKIKLPTNFKLLICSDGLTGPVDDETIMEVMNYEKSLEERITKLVEKANDLDGGDNVSIIVMERGV